MMDNDADDDGHGVGISRVDGDDDTMKFNDELDIGGLNCAVPWVVTGNLGFIHTHCRMDQTNCSYIWVQAGARTVEHNIET